MALEQTLKGIQAQNDQLQEMFLNLSKGQEEVKALLTRGMIMGNPDGNKDDQLELQIEIAILKGQLRSQMVLIQNLAQGQEELRVLINKLRQDDCNHMGQTTRIGNQVTAQPPMRQEDGRPSQFAATSRAQQQPRQHQPENQQRQSKPKRQFTKLNMLLSQVLQHMLKAELITLKAPPQNPNTAAPSYCPNESSYHSDNSRHDTNNFWALKNKVQDMIDAQEI